MDGGSENLSLTEDLLQHYRIQQTIVSPYHPQANGLVERGHDSMVNSLAKYSKRPGDWVEHLPLALWADRISVRRSTGYSAFELVYGRDCILPVELSVTSWSLVDWDAVKDREDLILARMQQLDEQTLELSQAVENLRNSRKANKAYFDQTRTLRPDNDQQLRGGDLVLVHNSAKFKTGKPPRVAKLDDRWLGPYRIREVAENSTFYMLEELDGTPLATTFPGNRLRKFFTRDQLRCDRAVQLELLQSRQAVTAERQARSSNPARLQELLGMIEDARNIGMDRGQDDTDVVEEDEDEGEEDGEGEGDG
jgi:hypothetical protein